MHKEETNRGTNYEAILIRNFYFRGIEFLSLFLTMFFTTNDYCSLSPLHSALHEMKLMIELRLT